MPVDGGTDAELGRMRRRARHLQLVSLALAVALALLALALVRLSARSVRTVLVPPGLGQAVWVEDGRVSPGFHAEWGAYLASLALSATPASVDHQNSLLRRHVSPAVDRPLAAELDANARRLKELGAATFFAINQVLVRPDRRMVAFVGFLSTYVNDRKVSERQRSYALEFEVVNGRPLLRSFFETTVHDPFGDNDENPDLFGAGGRGGAR